MIWYAKKLIEYNILIDNTIWDFINSTFMRILRLLENQEMFYSEHKKDHGIKFQAIVTSDDIIQLLIESLLGAENDNKIYYESGILHWIRSMPEGLYLFGDQVYQSLSDVLLLYS